MKLLNRYLRYCKTTLLFLIVWFGAHIFGQAVWHFVVVNVERWWSHGVDGDIIGGLAGAAAFVAAAETKRAKKVAIAEDRKRQIAPSMKRASQREQASSEVR